MSRNDKSNEFTTRVSTTSLFSVLFSFNFSPCKSSVTVIPSTSAIGISNVTFGILFPRSHLLTVLSDTNNLSAKSFCVICFSFRTSAKNCPNFSLLI
ncbi:hypothetical protein QKY_3406 [Clostridioides difficile DA00211]|nr:hypothetical protein QKY_3406 [Clostridioides difficile DA00211]